MISFVCSVRLSSAVVLLGSIVFTVPGSMAAAESAPVQPLRVLLVCGGCCHDYDAQKTVLAEGLRARAHVEVDMVQQGGSATDSKIPLYDNVDWAKGYDVVIHDECFSDVKEQAWMDRILAPHRAGLPAVVIHCAMHCYRTGTDEWFRFCGVTSPGHGAHYPHEVLNRDATHPIMQTFGPAWWNPAGELYHIDKLWPTAHALGAAKNQETGREEVCVWVNNYNEGTRVFGTTLGHHNETVSSPAFLELVTRGTLWAAGRLDERYLKPALARMAPVNLAAGKAATASSVQQGHPPGHAVDGDSGSRWCADGAQNPEWLQVDLGSVETLTGSRIDWESSRAAYRYKVEGSTDGQVWKVLVDGSTNDRSGVCADLFEPTEARHVRVTFLGSSTGNWGSLFEFGVFGEKMAPVASGDLRAEKEKALLAEVKVPDLFEANIFAAPPAVNYPVFVAAAVDGTLYVSSDGNGSLGRDPRRGRVLRVRDVDGDGRADEVKMFVSDVDSPRGLVWDHDRVYLLHPPHLSAFIDRDGDGISDEQQILVKNIAFTFKDRPADHTSNGIELGVDGWIYCAIGDFGFMEAEGTDGRKLQLRGGGVVRVRPDGTGLELFSQGTRNILEVAVSPLLDLFARDNTNDGGGWDVRLHHFTGLEEHGYPSLYKNFNEEIIQPLSDYGGGSGCGAAWIDEPGFPAEWNDTFYTADWGREPVFRHRVRVHGATYAETEAPVEFVRLPRSTDLDVDGLSQAYVASWKGATFNWVGPEVGYIVRVTPKGYSPEALPDFEAAQDGELISLLESPSHRRRLEAQRTLLRRGLSATTTSMLEALATDKGKPLASRVAALFALKQGRGGDASRFLGRLAGDATVAAWAIRALTDREDQLDRVPAGPILTGLSAEDARVRRESVVSLARLGRVEHAAAAIPLLGDEDPVVAHTAVKGLVRLAAVEACFAVLDTAGASAAERTGALRVLQALHGRGVVDGLIQRLGRESEAARRRGLLSALCRLHFRPGEWKGNSWGTRPDTSGPYYQPEPWEETARINAALMDALTGVRGDEAAWLVQELSRHKIQSSDMVETLLRMSANDPSFWPTAAAQLAALDAVPTEALPLLAKVGAAEANEIGVRADAVVALGKLGSREAFEAMLTALSGMRDERGARREQQRAREALLNAHRADQEHEFFETTAARLDPALSSWADAVLLNLSERKNGSPEARAAAERALELGWKEARRRAQILEAVALAGHRSYRDKVVEATRDADADVVEAARRAARVLRIDLEELAAQTKPTGPLLETMSAADIIARVLKSGGDVKQGEELFTRQGCANCHTVSADQPLRGPFLGNIATIYKRPELAEAILSPSKTIAQGFVSQTFELKDGEEYDGFVTEESADHVMIRNAAAQEVKLLVADIVRREKKQTSLMPEGLAANLTIEEFASLLDYLEGLAKK